MTPKLSQKGSTYRQKTSFTTRGSVRDGFLVSPAVMPRDSVPPSARMSESSTFQKGNARTSEARCHKHTSESTKTTHERRTRYMPIPGSNVFMRRVSSHIHDDTEDDEDDDSNDLERSKPVLCRRWQGSASGTHTGNIHCSPSSPYARTWIELTTTRKTQNMRLMTHVCQVVQNWRTSCAATRSEATETASLNQ